MTYTDNEIIVDFDEVHHEFGGVPVVEQLNLKVHKGERLAILGRTGAGKSTVLNLLIGNLYPSAGSVRIAATLRILLRVEGPFTHGPEANGSGVDDVPHCDERFLRRGAHVESTSPRLVQHAQVPGTGGTDGETTGAGAPDDTAHHQHPAVEHR